MNAAALDFLATPARPGKPRTTGLTILSDEGLATGFVEGLLEIAAGAIDGIKMSDHAGLLYRYSFQDVASRIDLYHQSGIKVYTGGIPYEIAVLRGKVGAYFETIRSLGFDGVEISEDVIEAQPQAERTRHIKMATQLGLIVKTELGVKFPGATSTLDPAHAIEDAQRDLDAGATYVVIEQAEIRLLMERGPSALKSILDAVGKERVVLEAGGIAGWPDMPIWILENLGADVNLENVPSDTHNKIVSLEAFRSGLHRAVGYWYVTQPGHLTAST